MRKFIDIISEAIRPTRVKTTDVSSILPTVGTDSSARNVAMATASRDKTQSALSTATVPDDVRDSLARVGTGNILRDLENVTGEMGVAAPTGDRGYEPVQNPDNLPAVVSTAVAAGGEDFNPDWHQVKNLPGHMSAAIRQVAGAVFGMWTHTNVGDIQMICDILNPASDVRKMAGWIVKNGVKVQDAKLDFEQQMPHYAAVAGIAECTIWNACGYQFLVMRDRGGHYVYGWPAGDSVLPNPGRAPELGY